MDTVQAVKACVPCLSSIAAYALSPYRVSSPLFSTLSIARGGLIRGRGGVTRRHPLGLGAWGFGGAIKPLLAVICL